MSEIRKTPQISNSKNDINQKVKDTVINRKRIYYINAFNKNNLFDRIDKETSNRIGKFI